MLFFRHCRKRSAKEGSAAAAGVPISTTSTLSAMPLMKVPQMSFVMIGITISVRKLKNINLFILEDFAHIRRRQQRPM